MRRSIVTVLGGVNIYRNPAKIKQPHLPVCLSVLLRDSVRLWGHEYQGATNTGTVF